MARKSLVQRVAVDQAKRAHNCQANRRHRVQRGDTRLKVFNGRSADHYCFACALQIVEHDLEKLRQLLPLLEPGSPAPSGSTQSG